MSQPLCTHCACAVEPLERRQLMSVGVKINFQPAGKPVPAGYLVDSGLTYRNQANGYSYGWDQTLSSATRDPNNPASPDQRYDTLIHMADRTWSLAVPNGTYTV